MIRPIANPKVALVYPPFGPPNLASLGLANLQAGIKAAGFDCRTFYWAYRFMKQLPVPDNRKRQFYYLLTQRNMSPWSEWIFTRYALGDALAPRDAEADAGLRELDAEIGPLVAPDVPSQVLLWLLGNMKSLLAPMLAELAPYDIVGIGSTFYQTGAALALFHGIKQRWPEKLTMMGGANCDGDMGRALSDHFDFLDYVFVGEVDHEVPRFVRAVADGGDLSEVRGLCYRDAAGAVHQTPPSVPIQDMNRLLLPDFDDWVAERKRYGLFDEEHVCLPLESSRGCWWGAKQHCTFCGLNANGMGYRQKSPERFQEEVLAMVNRYGARYLFMADNILSTGYHKTFVEWARDRELDLDLFYEIKANMSREQVRHLAEAGIRMVQPGIEHFSSEVLTLMRKGVKGIQNVAFLKYAAENGVITIYSILAGFPGEDPNAYGRMAGQLGKLAHLKPPSAVIDIEFHRFSPYHNTPEAFGVKLRPHKKYEMIFPLPERELARLAYQFVVAGRRIRDLAYISGVSRIVNQWRDSYRSDVCTLTWGWDGDDIVVEDRRMGFPERNYRVSGHAVHALLAMETPQRLSNIVSKARASADAGTRAGNGNGGYRKNGTEEASVSFSREAFEADPLGSLAPLIDAGLFWQEDDSFINLAVVNTHEATTRKWIDVQVP